MKISRTLDTYHYSKEDGCFIEYDGWHFEAKTPKGAINQVLKYIFKEMKQ